MSIHKRLLETLSIECTEDFEFYKVLVDNYYDLEDISNEVELDNLIESYREHFNQIEQDELREYIRFLDNLSVEKKYQIVNQNFQSDVFWLFDNRYLLKKLEPCVSTPLGFDSKIKKEINDKLKKMTSKEFLESEFSKFAFSYPPMLKSISKYFINLAVSNHKFFKTILENSPDDSFLIVCEILNNHFSNISSLTYQLKTLISNLDKELNRAFKSIEIKLIASDLIVYNKADKSLKIKGDNCEYKVKEQFADSFLILFDSRYELNGLSRSELLKNSNFAKDTKVKDLFTSKDAKLLQKKYFIHKKRRWFFNLEEFHKLHNI